MNKIYYFNAGNPAIVEVSPLLKLRIAKRNLLKAYGHKGVQL